MDSYDEFSATSLGFSFTIERQHIYSILYEKSDGLATVVVEVTPRPFARATYVIPTEHRDKFIKWFFQLKP